ncbi:MAG: hypothetical protein BMS9Abin37_3078 [Acidobacteriota bacterium]|nr:MAG: hypothetical protein BMS9Abin37_3078 [Acidobacteriota bacterium]
MRLITEDAVTASFGLAADETLARRIGPGSSPPTLRLYTYRSYSTLVGRFQNVHHELDVDYCREHRIAINRRPTGGGAILMGADQLGVALVLPARGQSIRARELMARFSRGLVSALKRLGVRAGFEGKNDVEVDSRKIAGLGIYRAASKGASAGLLFHASLLVGMDVRLMLRVLRTPFAKIADKGIASVEARITTLRRELGRDISIDEAREELACGYAESMGEALDPGCFTPEELGDIEVLETKKYRAEDWIFQSSGVADTAGSARVRTPSGMMDIEIRLAGPTIKTVHIGGDFFAAESAIAELEASLKWRPSHPDAVREALFGVYAKRNVHGEELSELPIDALATAIDTAVRNARDPYGCFVKPGPSLSRA